MSYVCDLMFIQNCSLGKFSASRHSELRCSVHRMPIGMCSGGNGHTPNIHTLFQN